MTVEIKTDDSYNIFKLKHKKAENAVFYRFPAF